MCIPLSATVACGGRFYRTIRCRPITSSTGAHSPPTSLPHGTAWDLVLTVSITSRAVDCLNDRRIAEPQKHACERHRPQATTLIRVLLTSQTSTPSQQTARYPLDGPQYRPGRRRDYSTSRSGLGVFDAQHPHHGRLCERVR